MTRNWKIAIIGIGIESNLGFWVTFTVQNVNFPENMWKFIVRTQNPSLSFISFFSTVNPQLILFFPCVERHVSQSQKRKKNIYSYNCLVQQKMPSDGPCTKWAAVLVDRGVESKNSGVHWESGKRHNERFNELLDAVKSMSPRLS